METSIVDRTEMTWIRTYQDAHDVLMAQEAAPSLHDRHSYPLTGGSVLTLRGVEHLGRRRTELPLFGKQSLRRYEEERVVPLIREALDGLPVGQKPARIELLGLMKTALLRVAASIIGLDDVDTRERAEQLHSIADRIGEGASVEWTTRPVDEVMDAALAAKEEFVRDFFEPSKARRFALLQNGRLSSDELPTDLIALLLARYDDWDEDQLIRESVFYLAASSSTTTHATPHVLYELLRWLEEDESRREYLADVSFLKLAVGEALRLHPPVPALLREAVGRFTLSSGTEIEKGEQLAVDLNAANQDVATFGEDAGRFNPFRDRDSRVRSYGASFSMGSHSCPGRPVAMGSGLGAQYKEGDTMGVIVRLLHEVFRCNVALDPTAPPQLRTDTVAERYASFPVLVERPPSVERDMPPRRQGGS